MIYFENYIQTFRIVFQILEKPSENSKTHTFVLSRWYEKDFEASNSYVSVDLAKYLVLVSWKVFSVKSLSNVNNAVVL